MSQKYVHETGRELTSVAGTYMLEKEGRVRVDGREVLYAVGWGAWWTRPAAGQEAAGTPWCPDTSSGIRSKPMKRAGRFPKSNP